MTRMIQYISTSKKNREMGEGKVVCSSISNPCALDEFEVNVINLNDPEIWKYSENSTQSINDIADFKNLRIMLDHSKKSKVLIIFPQNFNFKYGWSDYKRGHNHQKEIKNMLAHTSKIISVLARDELPILYESTQTKIENFTIRANFHFHVQSHKNAILSVKSNKITILVGEEQAYTTLNIENCEQLMSVLREIGFIQSKTDIPKWVLDLERFNDQELKQEVESCKSEIASLEAKKDVATDNITKNNLYKSILYTSGNELVDVVFEILEQILGFDSSEFVDKKNEDFLVKLVNISFIGEIKGIGSNVKSGNLSQLEVHYQNYLDNLSEKDEEENVKAMLIINHQRNKNLEKREAIHQTQIDLAKRNGSLIIETNTLLTIFEKFSSNELTQEEIKNLFINNTGLLII